MKKDSGLRIRVENEFRDKSIKACRIQDKAPGQIIVEFKREYAVGNTADGLSAEIPI